MKQPKGVKPDFSAGVQYNVELQRMIKRLYKDVTASIMPIVKANQSQYVRDSWVDSLDASLKFLRERWSSQLFQSWANVTARKFVREADTSNLRRNNASLGVDIYAGSTKMVDFTSLAITDNVNLIQSIPSQYLTDVESIVMNNIRSGGRASSIATQLQEKLNVPKNRAKMIARDQTAKVNGQLNAIRQTDAGFPYFEWDDSDDERVRHRHSEIANKVTAYGKGIYRWDFPPLNDKGQPILPGTDYQCRCIGRPVSQREVDDNVKAGRTVKGVRR